jgi:inositol 1,4,5-triphosphate receptor type 1/inositol 1,4,5-triphosphate receptor type 3
MFGINRDTQRDKILGLLEATTTIFNEIEYNFRLNQSTIPVTHRTITVTRNLASSISLIINFLMVGFYTVVVKNRSVILEAEFFE